MLGFELDPLFQGVMKLILQLLSDFREFFSSLRYYLTLRLGKAFWRFEGVKQILVGVLYRRRGRYAQPFVHSVMAGFIFIAVTFGPLFIAQTFPGQAASHEDILPSEVVLGTTSEADTATVTMISDKPRAEVLDYEVQGGDTVGNIASKFGVSIDTVLWANDMSVNQKMKPG